MASLKGSKTEEVAVRTNASRRVRGVRRDDGLGRTLSDVDFVDVAVPARDPANSVEVLGFSPQTIIDRLDATLKQLPKNSARDEPVIVALDDKVRSDARTAGLKSSAKWQHILSIDDPLLKEAATEETSEGFVQRVKREFAELNGVDVRNFHFRKTCPTCSSSY